MQPAKTETNPQERILKISGSILDLSRISQLLFVFFLQEKGLGKRVAALMEIHQKRISSR
jgi:hypothetical protein